MSQCRLLFVILALILNALMVKANANASARGVICPDEMGAKGDGKHDDTKVIQSAIDSLMNMGGGTIRLGSGTYIVSSLSIGSKVAIVGNGNGATIIRQKKGIESNCVTIKTNAAALKIADLSVIGNNANYGIYFEKSGGFGENHPYLYTRTSGKEKTQSYKWITVDNICIYHFKVGLFLESAGFNINVCNSTFSHCDIGVIMFCTDSSIYNCYVTNNGHSGIIVGGGNNKVSDIKSIFNGIRDSKNSAAFLIAGKRCQISNCESQDNYCKGFVIRGIYNLLSNCISNTDGYSAEPKKYDPLIKACGFHIKGLYNTFSNCVVTNYNEKYGAVYHSPIIVDDEVSYSYSDIYDHINVYIEQGKLLFHEPFKNVQTLSSKNKVSEVMLTHSNDGAYFSTTHEKENILKDVDFKLASLQILIDFRMTGNNGNLLSLTGKGDFGVDINKTSVSLSILGETVKLEFDKDVVHGEDDMRLITSFIKKNGSMLVSMTIFEKTKERGWIKKEVHKEINDISITEHKQADIKIGDKGLIVKRTVLSNNPLPQSVLLPYSNLNRIYDAAFVYIDADAIY